MKILIIDLETTGFSAEKNGITEVGISEINLTTGSIRIIYNEVCRPLVPFKEVRDSWIIKNKYMDLSEITTAKAIDIQEIQKILDSYPYGITAFNNRFDFGFLEANGIDIKYKLSCPMLLFTPIMKLPSKYSKPKRPNVEEAYKFFFPKSSYIEKHRGGDDSYHEAKIIYEMCKLDMFPLALIE